MGKLGLVVTIISIIIFTILWIKKREYLSLYIIFAMLFLPKINIIKISAGTTVGLRADDLLILLFVVVICFFERFKSCSKVFDSKIFKLFCLYLFLSTISALIGMVTGYTYNSGLSLFTLIRKVEYFCYIFVGYDAMYYLKGNFKLKFLNCLNMN